MGHAQTVSSIGGPRELPPASFTGQQYVDSRGCVFLKAGFGGQTNWVPRVDAQRKPICGLPPTNSKVIIEIAEDEPAQVPALVVNPQVVAAPVAAVRAPARTAAVDPATFTPAPYTPPATRTVQAPPAPKVPDASRAAAPAPYTNAAPRGTFETVSSGPGPGKIGCYTSAPVAEVVRLRTGGTAVVCTKGDGGVSGWRPPIFPAGSPVGAALTGPVTRQANAVAARATQDPARVTVANPSNSAKKIVTAAIPKPPKGYKLAWTDDRLNPNRAKGTAAGQAAQDQVWTRDVPARLVAAQPAATKRVTVSTKSAPNPQPAQTATAKGALVQVGTFGVAANADGAAARLAALGLPIAKGKTTKGGKTLQIVFAGPFASTAAAQSALSAARKAGFSDAFLR